jgi:succinyl-CoA synthetase alpha subunit
MTIIIDENSKILVQGITGKEGSRATKNMLEYGSKVVCGVTPGKGGQIICDVPVYDTVRDALSEHKVNVSVISVPPYNAKDAAFEAISYRIPVVNLITETIPIHDTSKIIAYAKSKNSIVIGPSSIGVISPGKSKIGYIGGDNNISFSKGNVGIISKSGGMCSEIAMMLTQNGIGQSTVVGTGGDVLLGTDFVDLLKLFENDDDTEVIVIYGEVGGNYEEAVAEYIKEVNYKKPVIAYVAGKFTSNFLYTPFGHAGTIVEGEEGRWENKVKSLKDSGVLVADVYHEIVDLVKKVI